ncbi:metalloregulator ArsR/SmtB family transcription factor [Robertmurraya sp. DFI.2.37]|uniref:ArsR/SmtB family transcription factor n=1 Tax=Robertmurraya sp. DFI.2.37 TaxID=3031819 RepID=UPI0012451500|nr:metalloregulator ArsR/SmtB family transcription factor [Robertmurraya sp. DFI.2.37]MDF1508894.1 metalloregulator ArsR/SmtB family transcription factor [Robertmurraya sp. DFI.2.37]
MKHDVCEVTCYDEIKVKRVKDSISLHNTFSVSKMFKALADGTRLKIAFALSEEEELCVCDVSQIVGCSLATASHHLRLLRNMGLAKYRKEGKLVFYSLDDDHVRQLIQLALTHEKEGKILEPSN